MSPHAGAIYWSQLFFDNLKGPVLKFQAVEELKGAPLKLEAFDSYVKVAKMLKTYQQNQIDAFKKEGVQTVTKTLEMNILKVSSVSFKKGTFFNTRFICICIYLYVPFVRRMFFARKHRSE